MNYQSNPALKLVSILAVGSILIFLATSKEEAPVHQKEVVVSEVEKVKNSDDAASDTAAEDRARLSGQIQELSQSVTTLSQSVYKLTKENNELNERLLNIKKESEKVNIQTDIHNSNFDESNPNVEQSISEALDGFKNGDEQPLDDDFRIQTEAAAKSDKISWIGEDKGFLQSFTDDVSAVALDFSENSNQAQEEKSGVIQYATIDREAVLFDAFVFDTLIGVSPNQTGSVIEPYRFKVELSNQNLMTSGVNLPEIETMRMSGYSVGEWSAGCVRGYITSATFVFKDGRISTFGNKNASATQGEKIAYITDEYGNPCFIGKKFSSLLEYASIHGGLKSLSSIGEGLSSAQFTSVDGANGFEQVFTGDQSKLALGSGLSGGFDAVSQTVAARYANVKDIIVSKPQRVIVQLTAQVEIDYNANGRKLLNHDFNEELSKYYEEKAQLNN